MLAPMQRLILLALVLALCPEAAATDDNAPAAAPAAAQSDVDRARAALEQGEVLPLATILAMVQDQVDARIIEVEFEEEDGRYIYEFELVTPDGRLLEAKADPVTGRILEMGEDVDDD